ncbi:Hsp20/alpha crystallin family protein [Pseudoxanthomonas sp. SE1]|uniref:Hsp20/alpha crystallin family protein n=1 Tax=Pseudoxanthomonas sp. SE1 TaxID=1664560 RepID=UPI00240DE1F8|nr:Hsp20/alpha crystallin family protein [Pseudoxanthomonas sp. SE1]WFC41557.1 Hsp20/alpha crystallin family protein [Pseudoxanthomonas sp. SE1]
MTMPTRWNPFRQNNRFSVFPEFNDLLRNVSTHGLLTRQDENMLEMRMSVSEDDSGYLVRIDVPGVRKDDIDISIDGNQVTVSAEFAREKKSEDEKPLYTEHYEGQAYRSFTLPSEIDDTKAEAHYDGGVLSLRLPKKAGNGSRKLAVN